MLIIGDITIENEILTSFFSCDLLKCKGACCTFTGELGAPILYEEIKIIENHLDIINEYLTEYSKKIIEAKGIAELKFGSYTTQCIDKKDCVFVIYEKNIALCAIEKAYFDLKIDFRKPISCELFPIRVRNFCGTTLYYEKIDECKSAVKCGKKEKIRLFEFSKDALVRRFGENWYNSLIKA